MQENLPQLYVLLLDALVQDRKPNYEYLQFEVLIILAKQTNVANMP